MCSAVAYQYVCVITLISSNLGLATVGIPSPSQKWRVYFNVSKKLNEIALAWHVVSDGMMVCILSPTNIPLSTICCDELAAAVCKV